MRVTQVQTQLVALLGGTVTDAVDQLSSLLKPSVTPSTMLWISVRVRPCRLGPPAVVVRTGNVISLPFDCDAS